MTVNLETLVSIITALVSGVVGREYIARWLASRQEHRQKIDLNETEQQRRLAEAVIAMAQQQSTALVELLRTSMETNQILSSNLEQVARNVDGETRDANNRFAFIRGELTRAFDQLEMFNTRLNVYNETLQSVLRDGAGVLTQMLEPKVSASDD